MIEFLTLFVGLVIGVRDVEVAVPGSVARVELRLNDRVVAEIDGPPWVTRIDFGHDLLPARFDAVAFDGNGSELGKARQWLNLPGLVAEADIVPIRDSQGRVTAARLTWSSPEFERPRRVEVELDGRPLRVDEPYRIDLTGVPRRKVHLLTAEFEFSPQVILRRELVFGPEFEGGYDSGLTAVVVVLDDLDELPDVEAMQGWFVKNGEQLDVAAAERPDARVVVVRDPTVVHRLAEMLPELERRRKKARRDPTARRQLDVFDDDVEIFALSPEPIQPSDRQTEAVLFPFSKKPTKGPKGIVSATIGRSPASIMGGPLMMSDAAAVAGIRAAEGNRRRAVIVLLGEDRQDGSRVSPDVVRRFLGDLKVALFVWDLSGPASPVLPGWGETDPVDNVDDLARRVRRVRYQLGEQRIVWLRGRHLPQEITLSDRARGISLAK
jgi:hypothetical protein